MKTTRFFAAYLARYYGAITAFAVVDILLTRLFGQNSLFGSYLYIFPWLFCWLGNIAFMQLSNAYAQLALGFGATRRRIMAATAACWLGSAAVSSVLGYGCGRAALFFFPAIPDNKFALLFVEVPFLHWLLQCLLGGAVGAWCVHLPNRSWWGVPLIAIHLLLICAPYTLLALLPLISAQPGWGWVAWLPAASGLASLPFLALALHSQSRMTVTT